MTYTIKGYASADTAKGHDAESTRETLKEAKEVARGYVDARQYDERTQMGYAAVENEKGECVWDVFAK